MIAVLVSEPLGLSVEQVAGMTDRQIRDVYFHPRNKDGRIDTDTFAVGGPEGRADPAAADAALAQLARDFGLPAAKVADLIERRKRNG